MSDKTARILRAVAREQDRIGKRPPSRVVSEYHGHGHTTISVEPGLSNEYRNEIAVIEGRAYPPEYLSRKHKHDWDSMWRNHRCKRCGAIYYATLKREVPPTHGCVSPETLANHPLSSLQGERPKDMNQLFSKEELKARKRNEKHREEARSGLAYYLSGDLALVVGLILLFLAGPMLLPLIWLLLNFISDNIKTAVVLVVIALIYNIVVKVRS